MKPFGAAASLAALLLLAAGCAAGTKSGGTSRHEIRLVMQTPDAPNSDAEYFIAQVKARTGGRVQIAEGTDYTSADPNNEARLVRALRSGKEKMAYIPSRAWERASSVHSFRALQAPFLVTDYARLRTITTGRIGSAMLASLDPIGVVGLGLVPDELRRLFGRVPLDSPAALRGARIRVVTSPTSVLVLRSLGAVPLTSFTSQQLGVALRSGRLDGAELATGPIIDNGYITDARYLTANVALFAKAQTIAIRRSVFDRLGRADQAALRAAAAATVAHANPAAEERSDIQRLCSQGLRLVRARPADIASLHRAAAPVYGVLERDPATRTAIQAIARLPELASASSALSSCPSNRRHQSGSSTTTLAGTYVTTVSHAENAAFPGSVPTDNWGSFRLVFQGSSFRASDSRPGGVTVVGPPHGSSAGTYALHGDRITFTVQNYGGDYPLGRGGDPPIICRWSLYRGALTFRRLGTTARLAAVAKGLDAYGPPFLYVKPWQRTA